MHVYWPSLLRLALRTTPPGTTIPFLNQVVKAPGKEQFRVAVEFRRTNWSEGASIALSSVKENGHRNL